MSKKNTDVTIKVLAEELGISKQAVRRYFEQLPSSLIPTKTKGTYLINTEAQRFIAEKVGRVDTNVDTKLDTDNVKLDITLDTDIDTAKDKQIELLKKEVITDKEVQINSLKEQVDSLHKLLDQQQQLTLQSNKQIDKLQFQLEVKEHVLSKGDPESEVEELQESFNLQQQQIQQLKQDLETSLLENEELKEHVLELNDLPKKGFWQRLFNS